MNPEDDPEHVRHYGEWLEHMRGQYVARYWASKDTSIDRIAYYHHAMGNVVMAEAYYDEPAA